MPGTAPRRFGLGDALILIAGLAAALALSRVHRELYEGWSWSALWTLQPGESRKEHVVTLAMFLGGVAPGPAFVGSMTVLALRLRGPRPRVARLARQPGFLAGATVLLATAAGALLLAGYNLLIRPGPGQPPLSGPATLLLALLTMMPVPVGLAVMASWFTLALNRRWRPEPSWLDRAGRVFGWLWLLLALANAPTFFVILGLATG